MILYFIFVHLTLLIPGYVFVKKIKLLAKNPVLELPLAYSVSLVFFALLATLTYALKIDPALTRYFSWLVLIVTAGFFIKQKLYKDILRQIFPLLCLVLISLFSLAFISLSFNSKYTYVPDPTPQPNRNYSTFNVKVLNVAQTQANDNYIPYRQAQFFVNRSDPAKDSFIADWGVIFFERTPLMGAVTANYFNLFNDKLPIDYTWSSSAINPDYTYKKFQVLAHVLNGLFIIPAFFLLSVLFNRKTAIISSLFLVTSIFFLYNSFFTWPKSLVAFFILTSWLLLLPKRPAFTILAGVISGVAFLTHDLAVLYIGASFVFLLINKRFRDLIFFSLPAFLMALPWYVVSSIIYNKPSNFIYYPFSLEGIPQRHQRPQIISDFFHTSPIKIVLIKLENLFYLLSPYQLLTSEGGQAIKVRVWATSLFSIPGALGLGLLIPIYIAALKKLRSLSVWILALTPVILSVLIIGWPKGLGALHFAEAVVILLCGLTISWLVTLKRRTRWLLLAYIVNTLQLVFFISYSYEFAVGNWFTNIGDILMLSLMLIIILFCGWLLHKSSLNQKSVFLGE